MANNYADPDYADVYFKGIDDWLDLDTTRKQRLLDLAATLIDGELIWDTDDETYPKDEQDEPVEQLKKATCEIAYAGRDDETVVLGTKVSADLIRQRSKIGTLETEEQYSQTASPPKLLFSRFPIVQALLGGYVVKKTSEFLERA